MRDIVRDGMKAGALGFSVSRNQGHYDPQGVHLPALWADEKEMFALCDVLRELGTGVIQSGGGNGAEMKNSLMSRLSEATGRAVVYNNLNQSMRRPNEWKEQIAHVDATIAKGIRLTSQVPMIVAAHSRIRDGQEPIPADKALSHAANLLWMLTGNKPSPDAAELIDRDLILHAEHGSNASSFAARVVIGTEANLHAAIVAAIAALSGPAHGGAAEDVMKMAEEIGDPSRAADYVKEKRKAGIAVTGFGHRVYRAEDPRARHMRAGVERLSKEMGEPKWFEILQAVVTAMGPYARHGVNVNVDFYSGVVYHLLGIKRDLFVPIFAIGRVPGWVVQVLEQLENNILLRPLTLYNGPDARAYVPLAQRTG